MRRTNRHVLAAGVAALALVTAACGGTDGSAPEAEGAPAAQDAEADPADDTDGQAQPAQDTAAEPDDHDDTDTAESADHDGTSTDDHAEASTDVDVDRTVDVEMSEFAFTPADLGFEAGETVRFVFTNVGDAPHEAVLGDAHVQEEHETAMAEGMDDHDQGDETGGHHGDIPSVTVEPGETDEFVHTFTEAGELMLGCHLPGHWNAGMQASLDVTA